MVDNLLTRQLIRKSSGADIREIPEKYARQICEYLGVE